jgi:molybdate transport system substrate-binding protein
MVFSAILSFLLPLLPGIAHSSSTDIYVLAGAANRLPAEELAGIFCQRTGHKVYLSFGGSGHVLSQMTLGRKGDVYFPGSSDFMELAKEKGLVVSSTERHVAYLVPVIAVQKGNPKNIRLLKDLLRPGIRVVIANPDGVCLGAYSVEIIEKNMTSQEKAAFKRNLVNYTDSCERTAMAISLKVADATIGWHVFERWDPRGIEILRLKKEEISRVAYIPIAVSVFSRNRPSAGGFISFVVSEAGKRVFKRYGYFTELEEALAFVGERKPVGGKILIPRDWIPK